MGELCGKCGAGYDSEEELFAHLREHHEVGDVTGPPVEPADE